MAVASSFRARLDGCGGLDGLRLCAATSETCHEGWLCGAGLHEVVVAAGSGMHFEVFDCGRRCGVG